MSNCSNHKKDLFGESDMKKVAEAIGDLHYETLAELLKELALKIDKDGIKDDLQGRKLLGEFLMDCADRLAEAHDCINAAYQIAKPFMEDKK